MDILVILWFTAGITNDATDSFYVFEGPSAIERCERVRQHLIDKPNYIGEGWTAQRTPAGRYTEETLMCEVVE